MANLTDIRDEIAALRAVDFGEALTWKDTVGFTGSLIRGAGRIDEPEEGREYSQKATVRITETEYIDRALEIVRDDRITCDADGTDWVVVVPHPLKRGTYAFEVSALTRKTLGRIAR